MKYIIISLMISHVWISFIDILVFKKWNHFNDFSAWWIALMMSCFDLMHYIRWNDVKTILSCNHHNFEYFHWMSRYVIDSKFMKSYIWNAFLRALARFCCCFRGVAVHYTTGTLWERHSRQGTRRNSSLASLGLGEISCNFRRSWCWAWPNTISRAVPQVPWRARHSCHENLGGCNHQPDNVGDQGLG